MVTLGLIGLGRWGINYLKTIPKVKGCKIKYISATSEKTLSKFSDSYIKTTNYKEFLKYNDLDGVIVATPSSTHFEIVKTFLQKKYYLLVEKPLTSSYQTSMEIKKILKGKKSYIMVGYTYLFNPAFITIKKNLFKVGNIKHITFQLCNSESFPKDLSILWELAPHALSICLSILGKMPYKISISGTKTKDNSTNNYKNLTLNLKFQNKVNCHIELGGDYPNKKRMTIIYGTKAILILDDLSNKKVKLFKYTTSQLDENIFSNPKANIKYLPYKRKTPLENEIYEFINFIKTGRQLPTDLEQTIKIAKIIDKAEKSLHTI